ncbi:hypothetical protein SADUNF_Sadunf03G0003600 [Salix dunnii]|uniref:Uncharacterized protein n=1 Tax=Salix dunnii TaxID=1413687 RepID=A0A835N1E8_9ROSI|nr:hypothetical protein SADUNF_Sadunf03G0003600 [Salix dunnii]
MNRYSKIKIFGASKSRSMDFSDLSLASPAPAKSNANTFLQPQETSKNIIGTDSTARDSLSVLQEDGENNVEESFGMKLGRSSSVSSSSVKKAFSMRRSSSVSERYCRIHDQPVTLSSPIRDEDGSLDMMESTRSVKKKHGRGRILKACKKLFGL